MIQTTECQIKNVSAHIIGNKYNGEELILSNKDLDISDPALNEILQQYFLGHFNSPAFYSFKITNEEGLDNPLFNLAKEIFNNKEISFHEYSKNIAKLLFENSEHPNIKAGELYVVLIRDVLVEDELTDAIGLFKSENKQPFLKAISEDNNIQLNYDHGVNIEKLDKGCLICNTNEAGGYKLAVIDKTNKGEEAKFWKEKFLQIKPCADNYHFTESFMKATKKFVTSKAMDDSFEIEKADKIDMLNSSVQYFRDNDEFNENEYASQVFKDEAVANSFQEFRREYQEQNNLPVVDEFEISEPAVKKQSRIMRSVLKLDKNFHVYIHGDKRLIEKGYDEEKGKSFYKIYFDEEK
ncbi:MAG TPA: nucleoid-associated protein [Bacteroidetes bacterium]|nr:nucleoid-associated protein [Bacteroidota bacterium]